jgi:integrase
MAIVTDWGKDAAAIIRSLAGGSRHAPGPELLGHESVETTMIYTHVLNRGGRGVTSPLVRK